MKILLDLEDTFGDIVRKASKGAGMSANQLAAQAGVDLDRLALFLSDGARPTEDEARSIGKALKLDPGKLADIGLGKWKPTHRDHGSQLGHQINSPHPSNGYFLILEEQRVAAFVDPGGRADNIVATFKKSPVAVEYFLITHKHHDHIDALPDVRRAFPHARVIVHRLDASALGAGGRDALCVEDNQTVPFGDGEIRLLHTPGHTDGSSCFIYRSSIFTGDTLFAGSIGGVFGDRFGYQDILHGVTTKIFKLPQSTVVLPGHGPPSTIEEERAHNPFF